ncbi:MAG: hypothetical protein QXX01_02365 [Candidatus Aenigmatarchaeota archaeon]|nr:hypothetical protein [Candidatus Aenigmarchaeota archaeon]
MINGFSKLKPKRPMVIRKGYEVQRCFLWTERKECLGPMCYWAQIGNCKFMNKKHLIQTVFPKLGKAK